MVKKVKVEVPQEMSVNEIRREKAKFLIETVYQLLRRSRKSFLNSLRAEQDAEMCKLTNHQLDLFKKMVTMKNYFEFTLQTCDVLVEGIKHPDQEVQSRCRKIFLETQNEEINSYLWKKLLAADYIPVVAQDFIKANRDKLEAKPALAYLLEGCESKFTGKEREKADFATRETLKQILEILSESVRSARKRYRMEQDLSMATLDETQVNNAKTVFNLATYQQLPIQTADLVYEGIKSPDTRIEAMAFALVEELLQLKKLDVYFWTKLLMSDWVPDKMWNLLRDYFEVFKPQITDFRPLIAQKTVYGRSEKSNEIYEEVLKLYVSLHR